MSNERCSSDQHDWVCKNVDGVVGEITSERLLTDDEIQDILSDPRKVNSFCPNGMVVCKECNKSLFGEQIEETTDFKNLESKLKE